jgi:Glyoxalase/Bleomycin resistance protein/Dioxygenase superfamily
MDRSLVLPEGAHVVSGPSFRFSQVSYATTDLDHACRTLGMTYGIPRFSVSRGARVESPAGTITIDVAQAFVGDRHIEIIEPAGGPDGLYRDVLPSSGFAVRHHHFGHVANRADEWARIQAFIEKREWQIVLAGNYCDMMHYAYVDTRAELGHYLEFMFQTEQGRDLFKDVPRF